MICSLRPQLGEQLRLFPPIPGVVSTPSKYKSNLGYEYADKSSSLHQYVRIGVLFGGTEIVMLPDAPSYSLKDAPSVLPGDPISLEPVNTHPEWVGLKVS